jgi:DNA-binding transcriptional LysR family regulator
MDLKQLRYFVSVGEAGGFRRAADQLNITQPALSRQIQLLEDELEVSLLARGAKGSLLSNAGSFFLREAREILERVNLTRERVKRISRGESGILRLSVSEAGSANEAFQRILRNFRTRFPLVELLVFVLNSVEQMEALTNGTIDIGLIYGVPTDDPSFEYFEVHSQPVQLAIPFDHPLALRSEIHLADVKDEPMIWVQRSANYKFYDALMQAFSQGGCPPNIVQRVSPGAVVLGLVSAGMGLGIVLAEMPWKCPQGIVLKPINDLSFQYRLDLAWRTDNSSPILQQFAQIGRHTVQRHAPAPSQIQG